MRGDPDVLVIGAGAAGLAAARELSNAGMRILLLEARDRIGGRIFTDHSAGFPIELGAEFVHGRSPDLFGPIKRVPLDVDQVAGELRRKTNGLWDDAGDVMAEVNHLFEKMPANEPDQSFREYIEKSRYSSKTRQLALNFVEGFHAADPRRVSVHWLIRTTQAEEAIDGETSFRVRHGYNGVVNAIADEMQPERCEILLNSPVTEIRWRPGEVSVKSHSAEFRAPLAVITLPLGVLQSGSALFDPPLPEEKLRAMALLESGPVIRVTLCFHDRVWEEQPEMRHLSFLFTDDLQFPAWWTSNPFPYPILTGWAAARYARALAGKSRDELVSLALQALGRILEMDHVSLASRLRAAFVHDWQADPYSHGAYSYVLKGGLNAPKTLASSLEDTLFFAGEAANVEGHNGTVHGAIGSGKRAAEEILKAVNASKQQ
ncbi:MAG TPA: NAD(P)/FAD-dependent oxidoreductase [Candidatus Angelobacter sp.]|nr:NAD(P)/FAD-dependent oxidoreductase [Candidatus Angelobacter sp.]